MIELGGQRVTVMGLGRFGGGVGVTRYLAGQGCDVLLTDLAPPDDLTDSLNQLTDLIDTGAVKLRLGEHNVSDFTTFDLVVVNPAVPKPWENRFLRAARAAGIAITTEIELVIDRLPSRERVIGVTGSAGKSTTASMIAHALNETGHRAHLGGNIGGSLLGEIDNITSNDWVVLELSSAMLHWIDNWSPHVAVITNLSGNHLDWHGSMAHYSKSKAKLLEFQSVGDIAILGTPGMPFQANEGVDVTELDENPRPDPSLRVPGEHNVRNARLAARAVAAATDCTLDDALIAIESFHGLAHRLEYVGVFAGVRVYNDSKSTTPEATIMAIDALRSHGPIHLIAGGYDKGVSLDTLAKRCNSCVQILTIGATGNRLAELVGTNAKACGDIKTAVEMAMSEARLGDIVLLSPACASWDQFRNFEERGTQFIEAVKAWACVHVGESC